MRVGGLGLLAGWMALLLLAPLDGELLQRLWFLPGVGVVGAIIANTSGTGGGVVFVPVFNALREFAVMDLSPLQIVGVSMGIQSFGMTMGALRWTDRLFHQPPPAPGEALVRPRDFAIVTLGVLCVSLPLLLLVQRFATFDAQLVLLGYKAFSIVLGLVLIVSTWTVNRTRPERARLERVDLVALLLIAIPGGMITPLFSVGIGELVALYLFIRHYPILLCTGTACAISSASMIAGVLWHVEAATIRWEVVLLAAPAAVLGGFLARPIALWLGARRLKTLAGLWIVLSALYLVWLAAV
ncbi:sulfite exporter TauE/SafE family protein [Alteriqipengyuania flavescens]|uniref:sulfite exporter TauE/SafE family protein n=1 Tax=Alteriqipengyuania flavescens TaxID=3053610 RepID=UPI0025B5706B|nr:sulfite exporter TauE/SafE family protein [Alteriqipengyuania flavescens]WJY18727.1 sulfite exporter TauE/SafE family protein [Alteriqipengyuania flavescens]WJY24667.1 sulfite exporter TauE/SafE family protein [Alteriqipengyuania flavescens]